MLSGNFDGGCGLGLTEAGAKILALTKHVAADKEAAYLIVDPNITGDDAPVTVDAYRTNWFLLRAGHRGGMEVFGFRPKPLPGSLRANLALECRWLVDETRPPVPEAQLLRAKDHAEPQWLENTRREAAEDIDPQSPEADRKLRVRRVGRKLQLCVGFLTGTTEPAIMYEFDVRQLLRERPAVTLMAMCEVDVDAQPIDNGISRFLLSADGSELLQPEDAKVFGESHWLWDLNYTVEHGEPLAVINKPTALKYAVFQGPGKTVVVRPPAVGCDATVCTEHTVARVLEEVADQICQQDLEREDLPYIQLWRAVSATDIPKLVRDPEFVHSDLWLEIRDAVASPQETEDGRQFILAAKSPISGVIAAIAEDNSSIVIRGGGRSEAVLRLPRGVDIKLAINSRVTAGDVLVRYPEMPEGLDEAVQMYGQDFILQLYADYLTETAVEDSRYNASYLPTAAVRSAAAYVRKSANGDVPYARLSTQTLLDYFEQVGARQETSVRKIRNPQGDLLLGDLQLSLTRELRRLAEATAVAEMAGVS